MGVSLVQYTSAVLSNGLGRYQGALAAAGQASAYPQELGFANWGLVELVEAAVAAARPPAPPTPSSGWRERPVSAGRSGGWGPRRARARS